MLDHILIRYGELALKKSNRNQFIRKINDTIKKSLKEYEALSYQSNGMRFYIILNGTSPEGIIERLKKISGIYSFSVVSKVDATIEACKDEALKLVQAELKNELKTIKVDTNRTNQTIGMTSIQISQAIARHLFINIPGLKADVHNPEFTLNIDFRDEGCFLFTKVIYGMGGMPAGTIGNVGLMISGGIDSICAGYLALRKGMDIEAIHFASPPYTSDLALQKVIDLLEVITPYTGEQEIKLHVVPFTNVQKAIYDNVRDDYGITIMRRMMYRIAEKLCDKYHLKAIVNGENIGQVASQTLESLTVIGGVVTKYPVIRPLATMDKQDIVNISEKIKTYDISIKPYEDCCTIFVPKHPQIKPKLNYVLAEEAKFDFAPLVEEAFNNTYTICLNSISHYDLFKKEDNDIF